MKKFYKVFECSTTNIPKTCFYFYKNTNVTLQGASTKNLRKSIKPIADKNNFVEMQRKWQRLHAKLDHVKHLIKDYEERNTKV